MNIEQLLDVSKKQYLTLHALTKEMGDQLNQLDAATIDTFSAKIDAAMQEAKVLDDTINKHLSVESVDFAMPAFQERLKIMEQFMELNITVTMGIKAKLSVIKSEICKIKQGRTTVNRYHQRTEVATPLVNKSI